MVKPNEVNLQLGTKVLVFEIAKAVTKETT